MQWEGTSDSKNKQDANIPTINMLCDCDSVALSAVSGSYTKCRSVQPMVRTQGETHLGKRKERSFRATRLFIIGRGQGAVGMHLPENSTLKKKQILYIR